LPAVFILSAQDYKVRLDHMGYRYFSDVFNQVDTDIPACECRTLPTGVIEIFPSPIRYCDDV
jgi:hypothetical protein